MFLAGVQGFTQSYTMPDGSNAAWSELEGYSDIYVGSGNVESDSYRIADTNFHLTGGLLSFNTFDHLTLEYNTFQGTGDILFSNNSIHGMYLTNNVFNIKGTIEISMTNGSSYVYFDTSVNHFSAGSTILVSNGNAAFRFGEFVLDLDSYFNDLGPGITQGEWALVSVSSGQLEWSDMDINTISGSLIQNSENSNIYTYEDANGIWTIEITDNEVILSFNGIPEPAEVAAFIGILALGFAVYRRRK